MNARWVAALTVLLAVAGCTPDYPLWTPQENGVTAGGKPLADPGQPADRPTLDYGSRRWQGGEPETYQMPPDSPAVTGAPGTQGNQVLTPNDPNNPYTAMGGGYTRQGTTIFGPNGDQHNIVGSTIFGRGGRTCSAVGSSLFCN